jgi:hypothetical protein
LPIKVENQAQIEEMQEQREVEVSSPHPILIILTSSSPLSSPNPHLILSQVEEITRNTERIKEQVDGVGEGLKEQLQAEYESVAQQAQDLSDKSKEDYVEPFVPPELQNVEEELPYSLDIFLGAAEDMYDVIDLSDVLEDETLFEDDGWETYVSEELAKRQGEAPGQGEGRAAKFDAAKFDEAKMDLAAATQRLEEEEAGREAVRQAEAAALAEAGLDPDTQEGADFLQELRGRSGTADLGALMGGGGGGGGAPSPPPPRPAPPPPPREKKAPPARAARPPPPVALSKGAAQENYDVIELDDEDDDDFL